jgi:hypothetical protein
MRYSTLAILASVQLVLGFSPGAFAQLQKGARESAQGSASAGTVSPGGAMVSYEVLGNGTRNMYVDLMAPKSDATVQRDANVIYVELRSTSWFCERPDRTATAGQFSTKVRNMLNAHLDGSAPASPSVVGIAAPNISVDNFAMHLFPDDPRVFASKGAGYTSPNAGPTELTFDDCYTRDDMQAIKNEVAHIVRPAASN